MCTARLSIGFLILVAIGCSGSDVSTRSPQVVDSAGVRVVDNGMLTGAPSGPVTVSPPLVEIGVVSGDVAEQLDNVVGATRLSDGRIVIANGGTQELRFFDGGGAHLLTVGGRGGGPGELQRMLTLGRIRGDTLVVADLLPGITSRFDANGAYLTRTTVELPTRDRPIILEDGSVLAAVYEGGNFGSELELFAVGRRQADSDGLYRPPFDLVRFEADGSRADTLGRYIGGEIFRLADGTGPLAVRRRPFDRRDLYSPAGEGRIATMSNDRPEIRVFRHDGSLATVLRFQASEPAPVTDADRGLIRDTLIARLNPRVADRYYRWLAEVPLPATRPVADQLIGAADGSLWVQEPRTPGQESDRWYIFGPDGAWLDRATLPTGTRPLEIGSDYLLGLIQDSLDVQYVRLHRVERAGGPAT